MPMWYVNLTDEERAVCLAIALSIQDTAAGPATLPSNCAASTSRPVTNSTVDTCSCQLVTESEGRHLQSAASDRAEVSFPCGGNSSHKPSAHLSAFCSWHEYDMPHSSEVNMESVFEPRPPHPLSSPQPSHTRQRCALAHDETVTVLDPWRRRPSSLDHGRHHKSHCTRPTESCTKKSKSSSRRRRSCGNHLPHRNPVDAGYLSDRTISPLPGSSEHGGSAAHAAASRARHRATDSLDLVISSDILESMLQGAEGYGEAGGQEQAPAASDGSLVASKDDCDSVFL